MFFSTRNIFINSKIFVRVFNYIKYFTLFHVCFAQQISTVEKDQLSFVSQGLIHFLDEDSMITILCKLMSSKISFDLTIDTLRDLEQINSDFLIDELEIYSEIALIIELCIKEKTKTKMKSVQFLAKITKNQCIKVIDGLKKTFEVKKEEGKPEILINLSHMNEQEQFEELNLPGYIVFDLLNIKEELSFFLVFNDILQSVFLRLQVLITNVDSNTHNIFSNKSLINTKNCLREQFQKEQSNTIAYFRQLTRIFCNLTKEDQQNNSKISLEQNSSSTSKINLESQQFEKIIDLQEEKTIEKVSIVKYVQKSKRPPYNQLDKSRKNIKYLFRKNNNLQNQQNKKVLIELNKSRDSTGKKIFFVVQTFESVEARPRVFLSNLLEKHMKTSFSSSNQQSSSKNSESNLKNDSNSFFDVVELIKYFESNKFFSSTYSEILKNYHKEPNEMSSTGLFIPMYQTGGKAINLNLGRISNISTFRLQELNRSFIIKSVKSTEENHSINDCEEIFVKNLNHRNILKMYLCLHQINCFSLIFEPANFTLDQFTGRVDLFIHFIQQLIKGIKFMHAEGIIHQNLNLESVLVTENLVIKISDFSSCIMLNYKSDSKYFIEFDIHFTAPECYLLNYAFTAKIDIFSFGMIAYSLLTSKKSIVEADNVDDFVNDLYKNLMDEKCFAKKVFEKIKNRHFCAIIIGCCQFDHTKRITMVEIEQTLNRYLS